METEETDRDTPVPNSMVWFNEESLEGAGADEDANDGGNHNRNLGERTRYDEDKKAQQRYQKQRLYEESRAGTLLPEQNQ